MVCMVVKTTKEKEVLIKMNLNLESDDKCWNLLEPARIVKERIILLLRLNPFLKVTRRNTSDIRPSLLFWCKIVSHQAQVLITSDAEQEFNFSSAEFPITLSNQAHSETKLFRLLGDQFRLPHA